MTFGIVEVDSDPFSRKAGKVVGVTMAREAESSTAYYVLVDLSNGSGDWKHVPGSFITIIAGAGKGTKTSISAQWNLRVGLVMAIDGTSATITWLPLGSVSLKDTTRFATDEQIVDLFPKSMSLEQSSGELVNTLISAPLRESGVTAVNTGTPLTDAAGNTTTPAVGDLVIKVDLLTGVGTLGWTYALEYFVG